VASHLSLQGHERGLLALPEPAAPPSARLTSPRRAALPARFSAGLPGRRSRRGCPGRRARRETIKPFLRPTALFKLMNFWISFLKA